MFSPLVAMDQVLVKRSDVVVLPQKKVTALPLSQHGHKRKTDRRGTIHNLPAGEEVVPLQAYISD